MSVMLTFGLVNSLSSSQFKKCDDISWCQSSRKTFKGLLSGEIAPLNHVKSAILDKDGSIRISWINNQDIMSIRSHDDFLRIKMNSNPVSEQVIMEDPTINGIIKQTGQESHFYSNDFDISILGKHQIRIKKENIPLITLNNLGLFQCSSTKADTIKDTLVNDTIIEEKTSSTIAMDFLFHQTSHLYGLPERTGRLSLQDSIDKEPYRLFNADVFGYEADNLSMGLYGSIPLLIGLRSNSSIGLFYNNPSETWIDILTSNDRNDKLASIVSDYAGLDLWIIFGTDLKDLIMKFTRITGRPPMPNMYSLGYHQCRWNYNDQDDVAQVDDGFDKHKIQMDTMWLDIEHTDSKKYMTWDKRKFPNPNDMISKLGAKGRRLITIVDPHIKVDKDYYMYNELYKSGYYVYNSMGSVYEGDCWPGKSIWVDFISDQGRKWWSNQIKTYSSKYGGIHIWNDMNEPSVFNSEEVTMPKDNIHHHGPNNEAISHGSVHNIYGMFMQRATYEGLLNKERPFVLSRSFYAGSQRWGAIWTGDNASDWSYLKSLGPMLLSMGLAGLVFVGGDVGGFFGNPDPLLLTRWYQAACLTPFFRAHAHIESKRREPWLFGEPWTSLIRDTIAQRYRLLPLIYNCFREAHETGIPIIRPMVMIDHSMASIEDQWMIGDVLLQKPITSKDPTEVSVLFPSKYIWYDLKSLEIVKNINKPISPITTDTNLLFVKGGSIIPEKLRMRRSSKAMSLDPYSLLIALDIEQSAIGTIFIDDGHSINAPFIKTKIKMSSGIIENEIIHLEALPKNLNTLIDAIIITGMKKCPMSINFVGKTFEFECVKSILTIKCNKNLNLSQEWKVQMLLQ